MPITAIFPALSWTPAESMHALSSGLQILSQTVAQIAATSLWQGIAITTALALGLRLAPRMPAAQRFNTWAAGFAVLVALPFLPLLTRLTSSALPAISSSRVAAPKPWLELDFHWSMTILALWLAVSAFRAANLALHALRAHNIWKQAAPIDADYVRPALCALPNGSWLRKPAKLCVTQRIDRPSVLGFFAPRILIPAWLLPKLTPQELEQVVLHETEHLRRGDNWTNLFQKLCMVLFPLNPALWWIERRLCEEREMACDDGVIRITQAPRAYATCLANLAERHMQHRAQALSLGAWQQRPELVNRVHRLLRQPHPLYPRATRAVLAMLSCGLLVGSVELARTPQLIVFTPVQTASSTVTAASSQTQTPPAQFVHTAFVETSKRPSTSHDLTATKPHPLIASARAKLASSTPYVAAAPVPSTPFIAAAHHMPPLQPTTAFTPDQQQWLVVTTWEQVQARRASPLSADYDSGDGTLQSGADTTGETGSTVTTQFTVTQLILKILPASSAPAQPVAMPLRNGWFVLQL